MTIGIYSITNKITGKRYIGSSKDIASRWRQHKYQLKEQKHHSKHLQRAYNKYKKMVFIFEILCEIIDINKLLKIEQIFLDLYQSYDPRFGYNNNRFADGHQLSEFTKKRISDSHIGIKHTEKTKTKLSLAGKGRAPPNKGKQASEETRVKLRARKYSNETRAKMRAAKLGKKLNDNTKEKLSIIHTGKLKSAEHCENIRKSRIGTHQTAETKAKISATKLQKKRSNV